MSELTENDCRSVLLILMFHENSEEGKEESGIED
jgi:hypothetical protein